MHKWRHFWIDFFIVLLSVSIAVFLSKLGFFEKIILGNFENELLASFVSGLFFTSVFTTPIAIASFLEIAEHGSLLVMVFLGALGAVLGDLLLFFFVRKRLSGDVNMLCESTPKNKVCLLLTKRTFRFFAPILGGLIIASPFPDELGLTLLGLSKITLLRLLPISFLFNGLGILIIGLISRGLL